MVYFNEAKLRGIDMKALRRESFSTLQNAYVNASIARDGDVYWMWKKLACQADVVEPKRGRKNEPTGSN